MRDGDRGNPHIFSDHDGSRLFIDNYPCEHVRFYIKVFNDRDESYRIVFHICRQADADRPAIFSNRGSLERLIDAFSDPAGCCKIRVFKAIVIGLGP